jgi:hypothetical protein
VINAFVEQRRVDLSGSLIDESWRIENVENTSAFLARERTRRRTSWLRRCEGTRGLPTTIIPGA